MRVLRVWGVLAAVSSLALAVPARAAEPASGAEKIRGLDIMLMVTALRCRGGRDNFMEDYSRFVARQMALLGDAGQQLRGEMAARHGGQDGERAFHRLDTRIANGYGAGHPWLNCGELKQVASNLAEVRGRATLEEAADQLLAQRGSARVALAKR